MNNPSWVTETQDVLEQSANHEPIFRTKDGWYFCDELWAHFFGPMESEREALFQVKRYCEVELNGHKPINSPNDLQKGMHLIVLEDRPFLTSGECVTVASIGKKNDTFDVELAKGQFLIVHKNDYRYFVRKS